MSLIKTNFPKWTSLSDFFDDNWMRTQFTNPNWSPATNVVDNDNSYEVEVAAPGLKKEDFKVNIENGVLTISGRSENEEEEKKKNYTRKEFSSKSFSNSFTLPTNVKDEHVAAKYDNGVLRITLAKTETVLPPKKEITIE